MFPGSSFLPSKGDITGRWEICEWRSQQKARARKHSSWKVSSDHAHHYESHHFSLVKVPSLKFSISAFYSILAHYSFISKEGRISANPLRKRKLFSIYLSNSWSGVIEGCLLLQGVNQCIFKPSLLCCPLQR